MGKVIITIDGEDYDGDQLVRHLRHMDEVGRETAMRAIFKRMMDENPEEAVRAIRAAIRRKAN